MRKLVHIGISLAAALALALTGCRPPLNLVSPGGVGFVGGGSAPGTAQEPAGYGGMDVAIKWPPPLQRATQAIPAVANTLHLKVTTREGDIKASRFFNRPSTSESLVSTDSLTVGVGESLLVEVNAYREVFATDSVSVLPTADRIIAQGLQENVTIALNATTSVRLKIEPDVTVAGIGGAPALGLTTIPWSTIGFDPRGPAIYTELNTARNLVYDQENRYLYFSEPPDVGRPDEGHRIMRLSLNNQVPQTYGVMTLVAGGSLLDSNATASARYLPITNLRGIASDPAGNVYYVEQGALNRVQKISGQEVSTFAANLSGPEGLLYHGDRLFVADKGNHRINAYDSSGVLQWTAGGGSDLADGASTSHVPLASASIALPTAMAASGQLLYVATAAGRVLEIKLDDAEAGNPCVRTLTAAAGGAPSVTSARLDETTFGSLGGIAVKSGTLYLSDTTAHAIWKVGSVPAAVLNSRDNLLAGLKGAGRDAGQLYAPGGLLLDGNTLYICDTGNHRIERIDVSAPTPVLTQFAGRTDGLADMIDGSAPYSTLWSPWAIATRSATTSLMVADTGSGRLRGVTPAGDLSTLAGYWDARRLSRGVGRSGHHLHMGSIAAMSLDPADPTRLYAITSDADAAAGGQAVYRIGGLGGLPATSYSLLTSWPTSTELMFENMLSRVVAGSPRVIESPSGIGIQPGTGKIVFSIAGTYHMLLGWTEGSPYELTYGIGNLPAQGFSMFAGTGPASTNLESGPATLVQLDTPRRVRFDAAGNCYFLTKNASAQTILRRVGTNGQISRIAGGGGLAVPLVTGPSAPVRAVEANIGSVADFDLDSQGNVYLASGTRILRLDQRAATMVEVYNTANRTFTSIAFDEKDAAILFAYQEEPKIKKVYLSRLF